MSLLIISDDISIRMVKRKALGMNFTHYRSFGNSSYNIGVDFDNVASKM